MDQAFCGTVRKRSTFETVAGGVMERGPPHVNWQESVRARGGWAGRESVHAVAACREESLARMVRESRSVARS